MLYTTNVDVFISKMIKLYTPKYKMAKKGSYRNNKSIKMSIFQNLVYRCKFVVFLIKMILKLYLRILGSILRLLNEYYILYDTI